MTTFKTVFGRLPVTNMRIRVSLPILLTLGATVALVIGCGATSDAQDAESSAAPPAPAPETVAVVDSEPKVETVEIGYEVGLRAPEFGMSLLDGAKVTSSGLAEEDTPVFLYFHATY